MRNLILISKLYLLETYEQMKTIIMYNFDKHLDYVYTILFKIRAPLKIFLEKNALIFLQTYTHCFIFKSKLN